MPGLVADQATGALVAAVEVHLEVAFVRAVEADLAVLDHLPDADAQGAGVPVGEQRARAIQAEQAALRGR